MGRSSFGNSTERTTGGAGLAGAGSGSAVGGWVAVSLFMVDNSSFVSKPAMCVSVSFSWVSVSIGSGECVVVGASVTGESLLGGSGATDLKLSRMFGVAEASGCLPARDGRIPGGELGAARV